MLHESLRAFISSHVQGGFKKEQDSSSDTLDSLKAQL